MKWLVIKDEDVTLEMNIIFNPYLLYDLDWTKLDPNWTAVSIIVKEKGVITHRRMYEELLRTDEIQTIIDFLSDVMEEKYDDCVFLKFYEPDITIDYYPEERPVCLSAGALISLSKEDVVNLRHYLMYISGLIHSNDERLKDMQKQGIIYDEWCWFPVAKLPAGKKAFVLPVNEWWHQDGEECVTVWYKPMSSWYAYEKGAAYWGVLKNCKAEKVYLPKILYEANMYDYWGNTDEDYRMACLYADTLNEERLAYWDAVSRLESETNKKDKD